MSVEIEGKSVIDPDLTDVLDNFKTDIFSSLNCVKVGSIQSFNTLKKTAQVQILFKRILVDGSIQSQNVLVDVPVFTLQGGGGSIQFPITTGDPCLLLFSDRRLDEWFLTGMESVPGDARMHDLSDGIALVGINSLNSDLPTYPTNQVVLQYQGTSLVLTESGYEIVSSGGSQLDLTSTVDLKSSGGGELKLDTLVGIKNATTSLLICLTDLITALEALTVVVSGSSGVVSPATIAALTAVQNTVNTLLE